MTLPFDKQRFQSFPVVVILRGFAIGQVKPIVRACRAGGLRNLEITMNTPEPVHQIQEAIQAAEGTMNIGAGTVTNLALLDSAQQAGANFIVTPNLNRDVLGACLSDALPIFPGAYTPTEIRTAWEAGAHMVKVFPSNITGPGYIKALRGPFPDLPLMPTGGINLDTIDSYLAAGASGFGVGSPILNQDRIATEDWPWLTAQVEGFRQRFPDA